MRVDPQRTTPTGCRCAPRCEHAVQFVPLTRIELLTRGKCCGSGCINCPYPSDALQAAIRATAVPIRSGPCRVLWLSHEWSGPRGQCGRCGQVRG
jgi:hypothetical protein